MGDDDKCCICLESLFDKDSVLGVTTPCGHPIHQACFGEWAANKMRRGRPEDIKCPTCNTPGASFTRIFINFPTTSLEDDDSSDDDDDDSMIQDDVIMDTNCVGGMEKHSGLEGANEMVETDGTSTGQEGVSQDEQLQDDSHSSRNSYIAGCQHPFDTIDPIVHGNNGGESVQQLLAEDVVDLTEDTAPDRREPGVATSSTKTDNNSKTERTDKEKISRRKAKRYKKLFQQMKSRYDELSKKQHELHVLVKTAKNDANTERQKAEQLETDHKEHLHELRKARVNIIRLEREWESAKDARNCANQQLKDLMEDYHQTKIDFQKQLKEAQTSQLAEMNKMIKDYPKVLDQKKTLQAELEKKTKYVANLKEMLQKLEPKIRNNIELGLQEDARPADKRQLKKNLQLMNSMSDEQIGKRRRLQLSMQSSKARKNLSQRAVLMVESANASARKQHAKHPTIPSNRASSIDKLLGGCRPTTNKSVAGRATTKPKEHLQAGSRRVSTESTAHSAVASSQPVRHAPSLNLTKRSNNHKSSDRRQGFFSKQASKSSGQADLRSMFQAKR